MLLFILPSKLADQKVEIFFFFSSVFIPLCSRGVGCLPLTEILCTSPPPPPLPTLSPALRAVWVPQGPESLLGGSSWSCNTAWAGGGQSHGAGGDGGIGQPKVWGFFGSWGMLGHQCCMGESPPGRLRCIIAFGRVISRK